MEPGGEALKLLRHPSGLLEGGHLVLLSAVAPRHSLRRNRGMRNEIALGCLAAQGAATVATGTTQNQGSGVWECMAAREAASVRLPRPAPSPSVSARRSPAGFWRGSVPFRLAAPAKEKRRTRTIGGSVVIRSTGERSADVADGCATQRAGDDDVAEDDWGAQGDERAPHGASRIEEDISSSLMSVVFREAGIAAAVAGAQAAARVFADQRSGKPRPASEEQSARHADE